MASTAVLAARYMTRFRCLAGDCEATCCGGGIIPVEETTHRRLTVLAQGDAEASLLLSRGVERTPDGPDFARIRFDEEGECAMRDGAGLCKVHQRFGHEALFDVCATYPRYASMVDDDVELFGTLSCPEVARLALLADDAFELAEVTLPEAPRLLRNRFRTEAPYFRAFKPVRAALVQLLSDPSYALVERLFVLLWSADKLKSVLHQGGGPIAPIELDRGLGALADPEVLRGLVRSFRALALDGNLAFSVIAASLRPPPAARRGSQVAAFHAMWRRVVEVYGPAFAPGNPQGGDELRGAFDAYARLRARLPGAVDDQVDARLARYVVNHLLTTPYMLNRDIFEFAYDVVVRVACLRFLLTTELGAGEVSPSELDAEIVRVTFSFVRAVDHTDSPAVLRRLLQAQGLNGFAHAVGFLAMWRPRS